METTMFLKLTLFTIFLALAPAARSQFFLPPPLPPRPLCVSQFALVNHACGTIPYTTLPPPTPPAPPAPPVPSPSRGDKHLHMHIHKHSHSHHGHRHSTGTPVEEDCCRWLRQVDNDCVCEMLVHLPAFLSRPAHNFTVIVGSACGVSYQCAGRLRP